MNPSIPGGLRFVIRCGQSEKEKDDPEIFGVF
jgi:hypothetical protein